MSLRLMSPTLRGIAAMIAAMLLFITNDMMLKLATQHLPVGEVLGARSVVATLFVLILLAFTGELRHALGAFRPKVIARSSLDSATTFIYVIALAVLPISTTTTIYMAAPLITTALAVPLLGEKVGLKRAIAIAIGFSGAVIVAHPDPATFSLFAILPLIAATCGALRDIVTRGIGAHVPGGVVVLSSTVALGVTGAGFALWEPWSVPTLAGGALIVATGATFALGNLMLVYAFRHAPVQVVSPLRYVMVPVALIYGFFIFGHVPDSWATIGTILVVGAGLYSIQQEAARGRKAGKEAKAREAAQAGTDTAPVMPPVASPIPAAAGSAVAARLSPPANDDAPPAKAKGGAPQSAAITRECPHS
ncbi:DMT family transporter [Roseixanthobacter glucoisosaccharinicivorans]|uniref:DMT family transporter n=1 Tax=Roseixanthobacter glucoisosaccharinicivorans TaxID=3119923 RepID=UPI00372AC075